MKIEKYICDIVDCNNKANHTGFKIQVIFTTDQTEGRGVKPYLSDGVIDICNECLEKRLHGKSIIGAGAQGHNKYWFGLV